MTRRIGSRRSPKVWLALLSLGALSGCGRIAPGSVDARSEPAPAPVGGGYVSGGASGSSGGYQGLQCYGASGCAQFSNTTDPSGSGYVRPAR